MASHLSDVSAVVDTTCFEPVSRTSLLKGHFLIASAFGEIARALNVLLLDLCQRLRPFIYFYLQSFSLFFYFSKILALMSTILPTDGAAKIF